jgi:hypothetical protein
MNEIEQMIEDYAHLEHKAAILKAHGRQVPADMTLRMEAIAAWGRANIHPAHFAAAIRQKDGRLAQLHMQRDGGEQEFNATTRKQLLSSAVARATVGMLGQRNLTPNQLSAIVNKKPFRAQIPQKQLTQAQIDAQFRNETKQFDPRGIGWGQKEFFKRMDELTDAESNEAEFNRLVRKYRGDIAGARQAVKMWKSERVSIGLNQRLLERKQARGETENPIIREVPDRERRKATLLAATIADAGEQAERGDSRNLDGFLDRSTTDYTHEGPDTRFGDHQRRSEVARAFDQHEQIGYDNG